MKYLKEHLVSDCDGTVRKVIRSKLDLFNVPSLDKKAR